MSYSQVLTIFICDQHHASHIPAAVPAGTFTFLEYSTAAPQHAERVLL